MRNKKLMCEKSNGYALTPESHCKEIFKSLCICSNDSFIDIGCGKGYVLTWAAKQPYKKVTGIDIDTQLIHIAKNNLSILNLQNRVDVLVADAANFDYDEYNHLFFFDPFPEEIMKLTIDCTCKSLKRKPRELTIIYHKPTHHHLFMETGLFQVINKLYCFMKDTETFIYRSV
jgi:16S rRNA G966 N2-methylase RsmD